MVCVVVSYKTKFSKFKGQRSRIGDIGCRRSGNYGMIILHIDCEHCPSTVTRPSKNKMSVV